MLLRRSIFLYGSNTASQDIRGSLERDNSKPLTKRRNATPEAGLARLANN
jgi:hypothetical protein